MAAAGTLTPDAIVDTAEALIVEHGIDNFSMRKLAAALGVNPMTVYLRFDNKDELLDAVAGRLIGDLELPPPAGTWQEQAVVVATTIRSHLLANPNLLPLLRSSTHLAGAMLRLTERGLAVMTAAGFAEAEAVAGFRSLFWHAVGSAMAADAMTTDALDTVRSALADVDGDQVPTFVALLPHFDSVDADRVFEHTTQLLVDGLAADTPTRQECS